MMRIHILKGFTDIDAALWVHRYYPGLGIQAMVARCKEHGHPIVDSAKFDSAQLLHEWGLTNKQARTLTPSGMAFYAIWQNRRNEAVDILHGLQYQLWNRLTPEDHPASWAYKTICDTLCRTQTVPKAKDFAAVVAAQRLMDGPVPTQASAAFSTKSIHDAYDWLLPLRPPVLLGIMLSRQGRLFKDAVFVRRAYCSLPLFVMAVAYRIRETERNWGDIFPVGEKDQHCVCAACLIEPEVFPLLLDQACERYPHLLKVERSSRGIAVTVPRLVQVEDFV